MVARYDGESKADAEAIASALARTQVEMADQAAGTFGADNDDTRASVAAFHAAYETEDHLPEGIQRTLRQIEHKLGLPPSITFADGLMNGFIIGNLVAFTTIATIVVFAILLKVT